MENRDSTTHLKILSGNMDLMPTTEVSVSATKSPEYDRMKANKDAIVAKERVAIERDVCRWRPIESAPRDGQMVLIAHNHWGTINVTLASWKRVNYGAGQYKEGWHSYAGFLTGAKWWHPIPSVEGLKDGAR
jgi:hypothetical protein